MLKEDEKEQFRKSIQMIWIIWVAMLGTLAFYFMIVRFFGDEIKSNISYDIPLKKLKDILIVASAIGVALAFFLRRFMLAIKPQKSSGFELSRVAGKYASAVLVSLAISETVAIFGLILYLLGEDTTTFHIFIVLSAMAMVYYRPKTEEIKRLVLSLQTGK